MRKSNMSCFILPIAFALTSCGGGSDQNIGPVDGDSVNNDSSLDNQPTTSLESSNTLENRLITAATDDQVSGWACLSEGGSPVVYTFFERNTVPGIDASLGIRYDVTAADGAPWNFRWTPADGQTVVLDSPDGQQSVLSGIEFLNPGDFMQVVTEDHGLLYCQKQSGVRS